ncbi:LysR substrate-binding domain-containing protein [Limnobacter humi]|uniref:LysR substrate-binding domain-containing protein n=1 Tax=Limnobacter humi TaxID=1778671 RepID=A0ABT1WGN9_9BURK|nr:LysR substrate-binding domain-containing protein [Limnobacter humi]MCQ8896674.1 LysR substrate-binding domain-containing protein [Limnobacter humi]
MTNKTPSLDELELIIRLRHSGSLSACADNMGVSAAYISKRLAQVESRLGLKLFHRTTRRLSPTAVGETVLEWGQRVLDSAQDLLDAMSAERSMPRGLLRVCSSSGYGRARVAPALSRLVQTYPELQVQLELLDRRVDLLTEGFHLDIRLGEVVEPDLISRQIARNQRILCASPGYLRAAPPLSTLQDLQLHECLVIRERDQQPGRWVLAGPNGEETVKVQGALSSNNGEVVRQWMLDGHGIGLRSVWDVAPFIRSRKLVRVLPAYSQEANVYAVYPSRLASSARLRVCVEFLTDCLSGRPDAVHART